MAGRTGRDCDINKPEFRDLETRGGAHVTVVPIYKPLGRARARFYAIHGPKGSWRKTWSRKAENVPRGAQNIPSDEDFWLRKDLPSEFPDCAVYSIAYSDPGWCHVGPGEAVRTGIREHFRATPLVGRAPVVFIAYGLGGVHLMEMLDIWGKERSLLGSGCTPQLDQLRAVLFFATPCRFEMASTVVASNKTLKSKEDVFPMNHERLVERNKDIHSRIRDLAETKDFETEYVYDSSLPYPSNELSDSQIFLGSYLFDNTRDIVSTLKGFFKQEYQNQVQDDLEHSPDWDMIQASFHDQSAPEPSMGRYNPRQYDPRELWSYSTLTDLSESWLHLPLNNEAWLNKLMKHLTEVPSNSSIRGEVPRWLGLTQRSRSDIAHSRYVLPMFEVLIHNSESGVRRTEFQIAIPYIHWDTWKSNKLYKDDVSQAATRENVDGKTHLGGKGGIRYEDASSPDYHPRRTMDQYAFPHLNNTDKRDDSQVVSKVTKKDNDLGARGGARMIMVDQLWMCLMVKERWGGGQTAKETWEYDKSHVVSSFPHTSYVRDDNDPDGLYDVMDVRQNILAEMEYRCDEWRKESNERRNGKQVDSSTQAGGPSKQAPKMEGPEVASLILTSALRGFAPSPRDDWVASSPRNHWELKFLDVFQEQIATITEAHNTILESFTKRVANKERGINVLEERTNELEQHLEISDVINELGMLQQLFREQREILRKAFERLEKEASLKTLQAGISSIIRQIDDEYEPKIYSMMKESERLQHSISNLLDLQQNEAGINEAVYANQHSLFAAKQVLTSQDQADAAQLQSKILFVFTFVTIVFLPLGFITSYYGMNIIDIPDPDGGTKAKNYAISSVSTVMAAVTVCITTFFVVGAWLWYEKGKREAQEESTKNLVGWEDKGLLPRDLIGEESAEKRRMEGYRERHQV